MAGQVRDLRSRLEIRNIRAADQRLLAWLRLNARGTPPSVQLNRTWTQVAEEIGLTREAAYRALSAMRRAGRIRVEGRVVRLEGQLASPVIRQGRRVAAPVRG
jgi:CRP-like cAMP-binding protein